MRPVTKYEPSGVSVQQPPLRWDMMRNAMELEGDLAFTQKHNFKGVVALNIKGKIASQLDCIQVKISHQSPTGYGRGFPYQLNLSTN